MPCYRVVTKPETLWDSKESGGSGHGWRNDRPKAGQGHHEYPHLWPEEVETEKGTMIPGGAEMFICGDLGPHCHEPGCGDVGDLLCDYPMGKGKTCDLPMCEDHAHEIGADRHLCEIHFREWQGKAKVERINQWPPKRGT